MLVDGQAYTDDETCSPPGRFQNHYHEDNAMEINLSPDELEILNWLHVKVKGFGEKYLVRVAELSAATELSPENYEKAVSYLKAYKLVVTGPTVSASSGG